MAGVFYTALDANKAAGRRTRIELQRTQLMSIRQGGGFDAHWREIADVTMPRRVRFSLEDKNRGEKRNQSIIDSTARFAARTLGSGLHAGLTSPARPWFKLSTPDPELAEFGPVKEWLWTVTSRMRTVFGQSNIYNTLPTLYTDMGLFGTAAISQVKDDRDLFRSYGFALGTFAMALNKRGTVGTFYREYQRSVRQVVEEFGVRPGSTSIDWSRLSTRVRSMWDSANYEAPVNIGWFVCPNENQRPNALSAAARMKFTSYHFEIDAETLDRGKQDDVFLSESGFNTFPVHAPRWDVTDDDAYGTDCPGMTVLGDTNGIQKLQRKKAQLLAKAVDPPLKGPSSLRSQKVSLIGGDITYQDVRDGQQGLQPIHEVRLEGYQHVVSDLAEMKYSIRRGFYEDLFLMLAMSDPQRGAQPITAREVDERHEEKLLALGPVLERTNDELLDPLIDRTYVMMNEAGLIPEPPEELDQVQLRVEYVSIMAQAQKLVGVVGQDRFVASTLPLVEAFPEVRHKLKVFTIVDNYAEMLGVDPKQLRSDEEAEAQAAEEAQAMAQAQQAENLKNVAGAAAAAGGKPIAQNSPLDQILGGQTPGIQEGAVIQ